VAWKLLCTISEIRSCVISVNGKIKEETMGKLTSENGFVRAGLLLLVLIVVIGTLYLAKQTIQGGADMDVAEAGKAVAGDLEQAAETVRDTSQDAFLTAKVKTALVLSKSASAFDVDVDSDEGTVTLTGAVPSKEIRAAVLDVARDTAGVLQVVDRIQVDAHVVPAPEKGELAERLTELEIESAVYERLLHAEGVDAKWMRVLVDGRVVRLTGSVPDSNQKERAAALVASVAGVERVVNELEVSHRAADGT
jgi:osmotically-inducible protein OsmY